MNRVVHFEIHAEKPERLAAFYKEIFGWNITKWDVPDFDYWLVETGSEKEPGINGGIVKRQGMTPKTGDAVNAFVCTVEVDLIDEMINKITQSGGQLVMPVTALKDMGWYAYCKDIEGNIFGVMQQNKEGK